MAEPNTEGRKGNAAQPLGDRHGTDSREKTQRTAERERKSAGPDGPDVREVGDTFKQ